MIFDDHCLFSVSVLFLIILRKILICKNYFLILHIFDLFYLVLFFLILIFLSPSPSLYFYLFFFMIFDYPCFFSVSSHVYPNKNINFSKFVLNITYLCLTIFLSYLVFFYISSSFFLYLFFINFNCFFSISYFLSLLHFYLFFLFS